MHTRFKSLMDRFRCVHVPVGMLLLLLQRTPMLRFVFSTSEFSVVNRASQVLKCAVGLAAMGELDTLAGATTFAVTSASGTATGGPAATFQVAGTVGIPINGNKGITFSVSGAPVVPKSFGVTDDDFGAIYSDTLPPGLIVSPLSGFTSGGAPFYNSNLKLTLIGTPTDPGTYRVRLWAAKEPAIEGAGGELEAGYVVLNFSIADNGATQTSPVITTQPISQSLAAGASVTFTAAASGNPAPTYQWQKNGANIASATNATYSISNVSLADGGSYRMVASNVLGSAVSSAATLTVNVDALAPVITLQPLSRTVTAGQGVSFSVVASGNPAVTYQWRKNEVNIAGATGSALLISSAQAADAGVYSVRVTNSAGSVISADAVLAVTIEAINDFNSDGKSDIIWQNRTTGERLIWLMNGTTVSSGAGLTTVPPEWEIAATGDFNADGRLDLVWQNIATGDRTVWFMNGTNVVASASLGTVPTEWLIAAAGDFNGDGKPDLVWQNILTGERSIWLMNGTQVTSGIGLGTVSTEWWIAGAGDFNADGQPDIYWQNTVTGQHLVWYMNGTGVGSGAGLGTYAQYSIAGMGDYNSDGKPDLLMTNNATGERSVWLMNGVTVASTVSLTTLSLEWVLNRPIPRRTHADFNRDGKTDIIWQNTRTGERLIWLMNGANVASGVSLSTIPAEWRIAATGDFNNDGKSDLVWQNTLTGERSIWLMNGVVISSGVGLGITPVEWVIGASGDFNNDGKSDLVLQNTSTNEAVIWLMNGTSNTSIVSLGTQASWRIATAGDFNNDGKSDIVWRHPVTGEHKIWLMDGTAKTSEVSLGTFGAEWAITGSGDFNQDGKSDLLWQNSITGERLLWLMNGTSVSTGFGMGAYPREWLFGN